MRTIGLLAALLSLVACGGGTALQISTQTVTLDCSDEPVNGRYSLGTICIETEGTTEFHGNLEIESQESPLEIEPEETTSKKRTIRVFATSRAFESATFVVRGTVRTPTVPLAPSSPFSPRPELEAEAQLDVYEAKLDFHNPGFRSVGDESYFERTFTQSFTIQGPGCDDETETEPETVSRSFMDDELDKESWELVQNRLDDDATYECGQLNYDPEPQSPYRTVSIKPKASFPFEDGGVQERQAVFEHDPRVDGAVDMVRIAMLAEVTFDFPGERAFLTPAIYQMKDGVLTTFLAKESFEFVPDLEDPEFRELKVNLPVQGFVDPLTGKHPDFSETGNPLSFGYELMAVPHNGNTYLDLDEFEVDINAVK